MSCVDGIYFYTHDILYLMFYYNSLLFLLYFTVCFISPSRSGNQQRRFQSFLHEVTVRHCMSPRPVRATSGLSMPMGICSQGPWLTDVTKVRARVVLLLKWVLYPRKQRKLVPIRRSTTETHRADRAYGCSTCPCSQLHACGNLPFGSLV